METVTVHLFKARDAEDSYAVALATDRPGSWRAQSGFGNDFHREWTVEFQSSATPVEAAAVDWNAVLQRTIEAYQLSDPVITDYNWPKMTKAQELGA